MTDAISGDVLTTLAQVVMVDLVPAEDNAVVIGVIGGDTRLFNKTSCL